MTGPAPIFARWQHVLAVVLIVLSIACLFGPSLQAHVAYSGSHFNDDVCQHISPFLRQLTPYPRDAVARYCLATLPVGYRGLYAAGSRLWDARDMARVLTYVLLFVCTLAVAAAAFRLAGWGAAWGGAALLFSGTVFLERMAGALPRGFAFPLCALAALCVVAGWPVALGAVTVLAALFYPAMAVSSGLTLALWLLAMGPGDRGRASAWSLKRRLAVVGLTAVLAAACIAPNAVATSKYGPLIGPAQYAQYPEAGPGGRFGPYERMDFAVPLPQGLRRLMRVAFANHGGSWLGADYSGGAAAPWSAAAGVVVLVGGLYLVCRRPGARRLLAFTVAAMVAYLAARMVAPHFFFPQRHLFYSGLILILLWFCAGAGALPAALSVPIGFLRRRGIGRGPGARIAAAVFVCGAFLLFRGGRVDPRAGLNAAFVDEGGLHAFVSSLPEDSCLAGWPFRMSPISYVCARPVFLSYETHLPFLEGYVDLMRRRMRLLVDAYFGVSAEPYVRLRDEGKATHLVVESRHMEGGTPRYFRPYDRWIAEAVEAAAGQEYEAERLRQRAVFDNGEVFVIDLATVPEAER